MTAYHVAIRTKSGDPYQWWGCTYDDEAEARRVHAGNQQAYRDACRCDHWEFASEMGQFSTFDTAAFELWRVVEMVDAADPDDLYEEDE